MDAKARKVGVVVYVPRRTTSEAQSNSELRNSSPHSAATMAS